MKKHLFSKVIVIICVLMGAIITANVLAIMWRTETISEGAVVALYGFWGGELMLLCLKRIFAEKDEKKEEAEI